MTWSSECDQTLGIAQNTQHDSGQALFTSFFAIKDRLSWDLQRTELFQSSNIITQAKCLHSLLFSPTRRSSLWCPRRILRCSIRPQSSLVTVIQQPRTVVHLDRRPAASVHPHKMLVVTSTQGCVMPNPSSPWALETNPRLRGCCSRHRYVR
jgi:hypothetical protein